MTDQIKNWAEQKIKLKEKFILLNDNDMFYIEGKKEDLLERLQNKLGKTKEEIQKIISEL